jgi:hypothetical protein
MRLTSTKYVRFIDSDNVTRGVEYQFLRTQFRNFTVLVSFCHGTCARSSGLAEILMYGNPRSGETVLRNWRCGPPLSQ